MIWLFMVNMIICWALVCWLVVVMAKKIDRQGRYITEELTRKGELTAPMVEATVKDIDFLSTRSKHIDDILARGTITDEEEQTIDILSGLE